MSLLEQLRAREACQPAIDWVEAEGVTSMARGLPQVPDFTWIAWVVEEIGERNSARWQSIVEALRNDAFLRLPQQFPERSKLTLYLSQPSNQRAEDAYNALRQRYRAEGRTVIEDRDYHLLRSVVFDPFALEFLDGHDEIAARVKRALDFERIGTKWAALMG